MKGPAALARTCLTRGVKRLVARLGPLGLAVALVVVVLGAALPRIGSTASALESFWAQLAAAFLAVLVGVPIAVLVASSQQQAARDAREAAAKRERARAADGLLGVLAADLTETRTALGADRAGGPLEQTKTPPTAGRLLDYLGGDRLSVILDPETIRSVTGAYDHLATWRFLRETVVRVSLDTFPGPGDHWAKREATRYLAEEGTLTTEAIKRSLGAIYDYRTGHPIDAPPRAGRES